MIKPLSANTKNIDEEKVIPYLNELNEAEKENNVKNIALMGAYGSGKSTILLKLKEQEPSKYININMIEFSDEVNKTSKNLSREQKNTKNIGISEQGNFPEQIYTIDNDVKRKEKIEKVEQCIIQQLIYQESQKTIPFSKMKREHPTILKACTNISIFLICLISVILFWGFDCFSYIENFDRVKASSWLSLLTFIVLIVSGVYLSFITIYYFYRNFRISKISFSKSSTNFECERYESVYNRFLDELLYFFKETSYDTVIFEDIDRYNDLLFFSHLRELNSLLNNSKYLNKKIRFIYAIKDDLFINQDKHKFFDYIIPVVPIMDYSNSYNKIKEFLENENIEDNVLKTLSLYISDMRTLINICNEFNFYKKNNIEILNNNSLLSIIVLKNLYPSEFAKLQYNSSIIDNIFKNKEIIVENLKNERQSMLDRYTKALKEKIYCLNPQYTILALIKEFILENSSLFDIRGTFSISILNETFTSINDIMKVDVDWDTIKDCTSIGVRNHTYGGHPVSIEIPLNIKQRFNDLFELHQNQSSIQTFDKVKIMNGIDQLEEELNELTNIKASRLFATHERELYNLLMAYKKENEEIIDEKFVSLVKQLILQDLINESYSSYISFTYKDKENENDLQFIRNVYAGIENNFTLKLSNLDYISNELKNKLHDNSYVFNYDVIRYLALKNTRNLKNLITNNTNKLEILYAHLDCNDITFETIARSMCQSSQKVLNLVAKEKDNYKQTSWLKLILCLDPPIFSKFSFQEDLLNQIANFDLIKMSKLSNCEIDKLINNLKSLKIKFVNISGSEQNNPLYLELINNCLFEFSYNNLIIKHDNLTYMELSKNIALKEYINNNIETYVEMLIDNNIKVNQGHEFEVYINTNIKDENLLCKYYLWNTIYIEDTSFIKSEKVCIVLSNNNDNIMNLLKKSGLHEETKVNILCNASRDFIKNNHTELFNYIKANTLFKKDLLYKSFYEILMNCLKQQVNKDYLLNNLLQILDNNNLMKILKSYNEDFRKTKKSFVLKYSDLNLKVIEKLKDFNLYEIDQLENNDFSLTKKR